MVKEGFFNAIREGYFDDVYLPQHIETVSLMLFLSVSLMAGYICYMWRKEGRKLTSISDLAYRLNKPWHWMAFVWPVALLFSPALFMATSSKWDITSHVFVTSLLLIGVIPLSGNDRKAGRIVLGVSACLLSQVLVAVICPLWFSLWLIMGTLVVLSETRFCGKRCFPECLDGKGILIAEILCMASFYGVLVCNIVKTCSYGY